MSRQHDPKNIDLQISDVTFFTRDGIYEGVYIDWTSTIGFGEYLVYRNKRTGEWFADSECMDSNEDKEFLKELLGKFSEYIVEKVNVK